VPRGQQAGKNAWKAVCALLILGLGLASCTGVPPERNQERPEAKRPALRPAHRTRREFGDFGEFGEFVEGAAVHFVAGSDLVEAVIDKDTPTARSFVAMLPMTLRFSDYGGKEKVAAPSLVRIGRSDDMQNAKLEGRDVTIPIAK
jgi:hypothetical protein